MEEIKDVGNVPQDPASSISELLETIGLDQRLEIAAYNSKELVTLAGDNEAIEELCTELSDNVFRAKLRVEVAYHSYHMEMENIEQDVARMLDRLDGILAASLFVAALAWTKGGVL